jgi:hypothetical protein
MEPISSLILLSDHLKNRDPRLWATVIYPGCFLKDVDVVLQTGQLVKETVRGKLCRDLNSKVDEVI